jgi:hypothetical protein
MEDRVMTKREKIEFISDLMESVTNSLKANVEKMPDEWDGHELRQYMADFVTEQVVIRTMLTGKRLKEYKNEVMVRNL